MEALIKEYVVLTKNILEDLERDDFENLETLLNIREEVLKEVKILNNEGNNIQKLIKVNNLLETEEKLIAKLNVRKVAIREELNKIRKIKSMNNQYREATERVSFLNKQI